MRSLFRAVARGRPHSTEHELLEALDAPVCAVCACTHRASTHYLNGVVREGVNDVALRREWRRRGGICGRHWRVFRQLESPPLPAAILTEDLLGSRLAGGVREAIDCPACEIERTAERRYLRALGGLEPEAVRSALASGRGFLCLHHVEGAAAGEVREAFEDRLRQILDELAEFRRRQDYRFADEPAGSERDSWLRAIRALGGEV